MTDPVSNSKNTLHPCCICGVLTDGWFRHLFWTRWVCAEHYNEISFP
jgi:hypothetical protein